VISHVNPICFLRFYRYGAGCKPAPAEKISHSGKIISAANRKVIDNPYLMSTFLYKAVDKAGTDKATTSGD
jgi:hypothetical protein